MRVKPSYFYFSCLLVLYLAGCSTTPQRPAPIARADKPAPAVSSASVIKGGGYYKDDGPGDNPPANIDAIPDAEPKAEPLHKFANNPYTVLGQQYVPDTSFKPYKARGIASWYGKKFHGQKTSSGELYDMYSMTAAHPKLPIPSYARVTNVKTNKSVVVRINDRGPFHSDRLIDLSYTAAYKLGIVQNGSATVEVESIDPSINNSNIAAISQPVLEKPLPLQPVALPVAMDKSGIYLQLGAFSSEDNANNFSMKIKQQLGNESEALHILTKQGIFRVHLGPYASQSEALQVATRLKQDLSISPLVVVR